MVFFIDVIRYWIGYEMQNIPVSKQTQWDNETMHACRIHFESFSCSHRFGIILISNLAIIWLIDARVGHHHHIGSSTCCDRQYLIFDDRWQKAKLTHIHTYIGRPTCAEQQLKPYHHHHHHGTCTKKNGTQTCKKTRFPCHPVHTWVSDPSSSRPSWQLTVRLSVCLSDCPFVHSWQLFNNLQLYTSAEVVGPSLYHQYPHSYTGDSGSCRHAASLHSAVHLHDEAWIYTGRQRSRSRFGGRREGFRVELSTVMASLTRHPHIQALTTASIGWCIHMSVWADRETVIGSPISFGCWYWCRGTEAENGWW
jgi:hypothetical protein